VLDKLNKWLAPMYSDVTLRIVPDRNAIPALEPERQLLYTRVNGNEVLTLDERRAMIGFGKLTEAQKEELLVSSMQVPFAMMTAQLDAAEETLPGGDDGDASDPADDEIDPNGEDDGE
jgi:phage portal protein BeeE